MEIEKKYLVESVPFSLNSYKSKEISQCYISTDPTIRLRQSNEQYVLTIKSSGLICREEHELTLTETQYKKLVLKSETPNLRKTRYLIPIKNTLTAEVDIYHEELEGLITVEVEFQSIEAAENFVAPLWFGRDVSTDSRYTNSSLCIHGIPK